MYSSHQLRRKGVLWISVFKINSLQQGYQASQGQRYQRRRKQSGIKMINSSYSMLRLLVYVVVHLLDMTVILLVDIIVLILTIGQDMPLPDRPNMNNRYHQPPDDQQQRHGAAGGENTGAVQRLADGDEGDRETHVREDVRVPVEVERYLPPDSEVGHDGDAEEPEAQKPYEDTL